MRARRRADRRSRRTSASAATKRVPLTVWATLVRVPVAMRAVADGVAVLERVGYCAGGSPLAAQRMQDAVGVVCASLEDLAARLCDARLPPDPRLGVAVADLDLADGEGARRAEIAAAIAVWLDAHRDEPAAVVSAMGLSWASAWIGYLAHVRGLAGRALAEIDATRG